jgi:hypothetical protein
MRRADGAGEETVMDYIDIQRLPTSVTRDELVEYHEQGVSGVHESVLRAFNILNKVKWLLDKKTDPDVIRELIYLMETKVELE